MFVWRNYLEIINPGCLYGGLQVEDIKLGVSSQRNPLMAALAAKTMVYRGLGSGIIRVMKEGVRVDFVNEESANQFRTIVWRTIQKSDSTIQKEDENHPNEEFTTQKEGENHPKGEFTTQKEDEIIQKNLKIIQKAVLDYFKNHPKASREDVMKSIDGITEGSVKYIIGKLQQLGLLKREGGRKNGIWVVIEQEKLFE